MSKQQGSDESEGTLQQDENHDVFAVHQEVERPRMETRSLTSGASFATVDLQKSRSSSIYSGHSNSTLVTASSTRGSNSTYGATWPRNTRVSSTQNTLFFNPSELEDIMAPLKVEFMRKQADKLEQAKAAYDQLNEQLMSELPQLIDLRYVTCTSRIKRGARTFYWLTISVINRVPYLDPTFEALVKIQLRFCAEAYSRMAQVQQYLDASTRDQYASGDLDARVEDVLGQIRELSIAGTV
jgi:hypothetical protein